MGCRNLYAWVGVAAGVILLCGASDRLPAARRRGNVVRREAAVLSAGSNELQREVESLQSDVKKAEEELSAAKKEMSGFQKEIDIAEKVVREAGRALAEIADKVESSQGPDSPFAEVKAKYLEAKEVYDKSVAKVEKSPEFQAAKKETESAADRSVAFLAVRKKWVDEDPAIAEARSKYQSAKSTCDVRRDQVLHKSAEWQQATKDLAEARKKRDETAHDPKGASTAQRESSAKKQLAKLRPELEAKKAALARVQAAERQLPGGGKRKNSIR